MSFSLSTVFRIVRHYTIFRKGKLPPLAPLLDLDVDPNDADQRFDYDLFWRGVEQRALAAAGDGDADSGDEEAGDGAPDRRGRRTFTTHRHPGAGWACDEADNYDDANDSFDEEEARDSLQLDLAAPGGGGDNEEILAIENPAKGRAAAVKAQEDTQVSALPSSHEGRS